MQTDVKLDELAANNTQVYIGIKPEVWENFWTKLTAMYDLDNEDEKDMRETLGYEGLVGDFKFQHEHYDKHLFTYQEGAEKRKYVLIVPLEIYLDEEDIVHIEDANDPGDGN